MSQTLTLPRYRWTISTQVCCKLHRWALLDMIEGLSRLGLQRPVLEAVSLAGKQVELCAQIRTEDAESLVDRTLAALSQALGANSLLFSGKLAIEGLAVGPGEGVAEGATKTLQQHGYKVSLEVFVQ